jgi:hypothetical protein
MAKRATRNYVNNPDFLEALIEYKNSCDIAREKGDELPIVSNYIGECIFHISNRLSTKSNFSGYGFREDMVMDGIENCLLYIENFNPEKSNNPFAYFTQIIWFAFLRRIAKEKKHLYTKLKSSQLMLSLGETHAGNDEVRLNMTMDIDYINDFIGDYEEKIARDKDAARKAQEIKKKEQAEKSEGDE